jgi:AraC-like DNA-binding protein
MEVWINDKRAILKSGEMSVALSYDAHCYQSIDHSRSNFMIVPTYMCEEFINSTKSKRLSDPFIRDKAIVSKMRECYEEIKKDSSNKIKTLGYIYVILGLLMEHIKFENTPQSIDHKLSSRVLVYINENYKNDISLQSISSEFGYSTAYLSRYFKSCFGVGINQYITLIRLKAAIILLRERTHSVTYCALESGFNSTRSFYRAFASDFNCTPKKYIENLK